MALPRRDFIGNHGGPQCLHNTLLSSRHHLLSLQTLGPPRWIDARQQGAWGQRSSSRGGVEMWQWQRSAVGWWRLGAGWGPLAVTLDGGARRQGGGARGGAPMSGGIYQYKERNLIGGLRGKNINKPAKKIQIKLRNKKYMKK